MRGSVHPRACFVSGAVVAVRSVHPAALGVFEGWNLPKERLPTDAALPALAHCHLLGSTCVLCFALLVVATDVAAIWVAAKGAVNDFIAQRGLSSNRQGTPPPSA